MVPYCYSGDNSKVTSHFTTVQSNLLWIESRLFAGQKGVKFVLKAKPQSTVVDADNSVDLNASDAVNLKVW